MAVDAARAKSLFLNASDLADAAERAAYLDGECGGDSELRDRVEALLRANDDSPLPSPGAAEANVATGVEELDSAATGEHRPDVELSPPGIPTTAEFRPKLEPGSMISRRYTLLEPIGEGGMGEVWVARQTEPVKRKVALKLIKPGMDSRAVLQRFEQERQALALMDHPNIAKVLDAGLTPDGRPFFVMELVNGLPLNKFCDEARLATKDRLELFVTICQAVQHAHQKGIVHRDLKPANILVTIIDARPVPKVIDFGVAKATGGKLTDETMSTMFGSVVGTLEYMSPEQAGYSGMDVDTRADIYSLGVILYELLTGLRPIDAARLKKAALTEMIRIIREEEPSKPSTRLSTDASLPSTAALRQTEPRKLMALLRGELDWVVMKCLEKHRERRYETANALARDVQRYLADEEVEARPPSAGYRLGKFLHRNKGPVLAASLILLTVLVGLTAVVAIEARANASLKKANDALAEANGRATKANAELVQANADLKTSKAAVVARYDLAVYAIKTFHTGVSEDFLLKEDQFKELRNRLLKSAADFFGKLGGMLGKETDFEARRSLAQSNFELAELTQKIGSQEDALAMHRSVLLARERLETDPAADAGTKADVGRSLTEIANTLYLTGKSDEALVMYRRSESLLASLIVHDPSARSALANCRSRLARQLLFSGQSSLALAVCKISRRDQEILASIPGASAAARLDLASILNELGLALWWTGRVEEAEAEFRTSIAIRQELADKFLDSADFKSRLSSAHSHLGYVLSLTGKPQEAEVETRKAIQIDQRLVDKNPGVTKFRRNLANQRTNLGWFLANAGGPKAAETEYLAALEILLKLDAENNADTDIRDRLARSHYLYGILLLQVGRPVKSEAHCLKAVEIYRELAAKNPTLTDVKALLSESIIYWGDAVRSLARMTESRDHYQRAVEISEQLVRYDPNSLWYRIGLACSLRRRGLILLDLGDCIAAEADTRRALELFEGLPQRSGVHVFEAASCHAALASLVGRPRSRVSGAEGEAEAASAMERLRGTVEMGYRNVNQLRIESALDVLRSRDDFRLLMLDLAFPADPFSR